VTLVSQINHRISREIMPESATTRHAQFHKSGWNTHVSCIDTISLAAGQDGHGSARLCRKTFSPKIVGSPPPPESDPSRFDKGLNRA
jgi:hypothetical protein